MGVAYEAVFYGVGQVKKDTPTGFAMFHYDTSPSPLSIAGGGNNSIFGPGGVIPGALEVFGDVTGMMNPDSQVSPLGVLGTVIKGANLVKNIKGVTKESLRAEGYKIINSTLQKVARGGLNGLGVNLNLNKGNNYATAGQFLGTPVAVVSAAAIGQEFGGGTVSQSGSASGGTPPASASAAAASLAKGLSLDKAKSALDGIKFNKAVAEDASPDGETPAQGSYFNAPEPLIDTDPFERPEIDENSAAEDIQATLDELNSSWAADNEFVSGQVPDTNDITDKLNNAASYEEYVAIKQNADDVFAKTKEVQATVDSKYSNEHQRLTSLLQQVRGNTSGSDSVQSFNDDEPTDPSEESTAVPPDFEF
jgi:hypothetical protein